MRVVIQRVSQAQASVEGHIVASIGNGICLLIGIHEQDTHEDLEWICKKITRMRIFEDEQQKMNLSIIETKGDILSISQFTLLASTHKGNRPSFIRAARPEVAERLYNTFNQMVEEELNITVKRGIFGANMDISLVNDGPVTIVIDSKNKE